ncbi:long-chain fatty acid--CoA ligase [Rhodovibrionaceae bacterium A322]
MHGLMMDRPLLISSIIDYAADTYPHREVVSKRVEGDLHRYTYPQMRERIVQLSHGLRRKLGIKPDDRLGTIAWNGYRHMELYYGISGLGAICHTMNPRLHPEQVIYIVNHAADRYVFVDLTFLPLMEALIDHFPKLEGVVVMTDQAHMPAESKIRETAGKQLLCYEDLLSGEDTDIVWPEFDERQAAGLCYTSGTTGNPKGVLYSHRSNLLHAFSILAQGSLKLGQDHQVLPVVPLFHVNAWGLPYMGPLSGTTIVFPGAGMDGASLFDLMASEKVTSAWGVPTVWLGLLAEFAQRNAAPESLEEVIIGGSAPARSMVEAFEIKWNIKVTHGWGMTEMSPVGTLGNLPSHYEEKPVDERIDYIVRQGRRMFGVEMKLVDDEGRRQPHDGKSRGELLVRGPAVTSGYYEDPEANKAAFDDEGWFRTGDVATISSDGYLDIVDRAKDIIKSGGEWISSIDLENAAMGHPEVLEAAVIGLPHPKWDERPLLVVVPMEGQSPDKDSLLAHLSDKVAKWWLPDDIVFVEELPHSATGKLQKVKLRAQFENHKLPAGE